MAISMVPYGPRVIGCLALYGLKSKVPYGPRVIGCLTWYGLKSKVPYGHKYGTLWP